MRMSSIVVAAAALALSASLAEAQEAMSTAGASGPTPSQIAAAAVADPAPARRSDPPIDTAEQIRRWLADSPAAEADEALAEREPRERKVHGEVGVAVGTGGYRSGYITSVMPLGETGTLVISLGQEKNGYRHYWNGGHAYGGIDYGLGR